MASRPDLIGRDFTAATPGTKLVGNISYIRTWTGWLYLATVIDLATRKVIGWSMNTHMRTRLIVDALNMAAGNGTLKPGCIFHSDRGVQYCSVEYATALKSHGLDGSMAELVSAGTMPSLSLSSLRIRRNLSTVPHSRHRGMPGKPSPHTLKFSKTGGDSTPPSATAHPPKQKATSRPQTPIAA